MKATKFDNEKGSDRIPFWKPFSWVGYLWRYLLFLLLFFFLVICIFPVRKTKLPDEFPVAPSPYYHQSDSIRAPSGPGHSDWPGIIHGGDNGSLPAPDDNRIPPLNRDDIVPNPGNGGATEIISNQLYVIFNDKLADDGTFKIFSQRLAKLHPDCAIQYYNAYAKTALLIVPPSKRDEYCDSLNSQIPEVDFLVVPVEVMETGVYPDDPIFKYPELSWFYDTIQAPEAWEVCKGSSRITIGVVDSFFDLRHEEFAGTNFLYPFSVIKGNDDVYPVNGIDMASASHGTFVTSLIVGAMDSGTGGAGIAPGCNVIPVSLGTDMTTVTVVEGLLYCMYHGANVINLSIETAFTKVASKLSIDEQIRYSETTSLAEQGVWDYVFALADEHNVTIVWAAGNGDLFCAMDPMLRNSNTVKVSAVNRRLRKASFSNFGNFFDMNIEESTISAPGEDVVGAVSGNCYDKWSGTSFSAPIVAGAVALMKSINPALGNKEVIDILQATGKPLPDAPTIGKLLQIKDALDMVYGQFAKFEDLHDNPNDIIGLWETTGVLDVTSGRDNIPTGEKCILRLRFTSPSSGEIIVVVDSRGCSYTAPIKVDWGQDSIVVSQIGDAKSAVDNVHSFNPVNIVMAPDVKGLAVCRASYDSGISFECNMRKIS